MDGIAALTTSNKEAELLKRIGNLENTNKNLQNDVTQLKETVAKLTMLINDLQKKCGAATAGAGAAAKPAAAAAPAPKKADDDDDDGVDLFGSDSEEDDEEAKKIREQRLAEYASRKSKKPVLIAKSNIILDVKPWDDETNMQELEAAVRKVSCDGLVWGASKLVPLAYGIHKLQISCVVEDDKVSVDWLQETIQEIEDYVQSVDIAAFNKV